MIEDAGYNLNWGIKPVLFHIGDWPVSSYSFFVMVALLAAVLVYLYEASKAKEASENSFYIFMAAVFGGVLGAKIPVWVMNFHQIIANWPNLDFIFSGRTIIGGLIGGTLAVVLTRNHLKIKDKKGNLFVPSLGIAIFFGRIGCLLRGCCYGTATDLPWSVNMGDGIMRHPTQLYEAIFGLIVFIATIKLDKTRIKAGLLFQIFLITYFTFRFLMEFLRTDTKIFIGLTLAQVVAIIVITLNSISLIKGARYERT